MTSFRQTLKTGLAVFSMFFGAGNILFPLSVGYFTQDKVPYAILGLLISAVAIPFSGLLAITLYDGDYKTFFARIGKLPGAMLIGLLLLLLGPLGVIPRCVALSYATIKLSAPSLSMWMFSAVSCVVIFYCTIKKTRMIDLLGYGLTPLLLGSLAIIIVLGLLSPAQPLSVDQSPMQVFWLGLTEGYKTMDLLAAFFFGSVIAAHIREQSKTDKDCSPTALTIKTLKAGLIGVGLLAVMYIGFCYISARHGSALGVLLPEQLLGAISLHLLGPYAGLVACVAVALACLTTAMALSAIFADYLRTSVSGDRLSYSSALGITLTLTFVVSTMELSGIMAILSPILDVCYPVLIVLTLANIAIKLWQPVTPLQVSAEAVE